MDYAILLLLSIFMILILVLTILTYISRCVVLVRFYIKTAYKDAAMLPFLYTLLAIFTGVVAVYLAKCEYEAITKK